MEMVFSGVEHRAKAIIINGPDGAEGYLGRVHFWGCKVFSL